MDCMDSMDKLTFSSPFCPLGPLGPQNAGLRQKCVVKYKEQMKHPQQFQNRAYFNLKICQAAGIFKIKKDKSFCHKPSIRHLISPLIWSIFRFTPKMKHSLRSYDVKMPHHRFCLFDGLWQKLLSSLILKIPAAWQIFKLKYSFFLKLLGVFHLLFIFYRVFLVQTGILWTKWTK